MLPDSASSSRGVVVWSHARDVLRAFRPQMWVVLQDLALDAEWRDGRLVAPTSARLVAGHLHIDPGTAATALRALRDQGVAELCQTSGTAGRFGLAAYTLQLPPGLEILSPRAEPPHTEPPHTEQSYTAESAIASSRRARSRRAEAAERWSQDPLDLGTNDS
jgi:hypothetical protein